MAEDRTGPFRGDHWQTPDLPLGHQGRGDGRVIGRRNAERLGNDVRADAVLGEPPPLGHERLHGVDD